MKGALDAMLTTHELEVYMLGVTAVELPEAVRNFRPRCPGCTPESIAKPGARPCSYFDCPGLPSALEVTCDTCVYDFVADEGQVKCDHDTCETAIRLKANVAIFEAWMRLIAAEASSPT